MAVLHARGLMQQGQSFEARSIIGSRFTGRIAKTLQLGGRSAIIPEISGRAWITGHHKYWLDASDPWPEGYKLSDTWGV